MLDYVLVCYSHHSVIVDDQRYYTLVYCQFVMEGGDELLEAWPDHIRQYSVQ
jgi:hypothetical protein